MSNLVKKELTLDSREVAKMVVKDHTHLMRDIRTYIGYLGESGELSFQPSDFFIESSYINSQNKKQPCYQVTKKGCELIAHKMTGEKGVQFTATYINKFHDMETALKQPEIVKQVQSPEDKKNLADARLRNAKARQANILLKIADKQEINPRYKQVLYSYATAITTGKELLPLPEAEEKTYTAEEIGKQLGISANMVGRLTKEHNLKTEQFGKLFHDKSRYSAKEVESFSYFETVIPILKGFVNNKVG